VKVRRVDFMKLTHLTRESFDARARRKQFPFTSTDLRGGTYPILAAYLTLLADDFNQTFGMYLTDACRLALALSGGLQRRWPDIVTTSQDLTRANIFCGRVDLPFSEPRRRQPPPIWKPVVGTVPEIAREIGKISVTRVALTNASRWAAVLRARALNANLDLSPFWKTA
jgi:hypothetical protein